MNTLSTLERAQAYRLLTNLVRSGEHNTFDHSIRAELNILSYINRHNPQLPLHKERAHVFLMIEKAAEQNWEKGERFIFKPVILSPFSSPATIKDLTERLQKTAAENPLRQYLRYRSYLERNVPRPSKLGSELSPSDIQSFREQTTLLSLATLCAIAQERELEDLIDIIPEEQNGFPAFKLKDESPSWFKSLFYFRMYRGVERDRRTWYRDLSRDRPSFFAAFAYHSTDTTDRKRVDIAMAELSDSYKQRTVEADQAFIHPLLRRQKIRDSLQRPIAEAATSLQILKENVLAQILESKPLNIALAGWLLITTADLKWNDLIKGRSAFVAIGMFREVANRIDDILDNMPAAEITTMEVSLGPKASPMLERLLTQEDREVFSNLVDKGAITLPELWNFGNLLCHTLQTEAQIAQEYRQHPEKSHREKLAEQHLRTDSVYMALAGHFFVRDPRICQHEHLDFAKLRRIYPTTVRLGAALQILDDLKDWVIDWKEEQSSGRVSANFFLGQMEQHNLLTRPHMEKISRLSAARVQMHEIPWQFREVIRKQKAAFEIMIRDAPLHTRLTFNNFWDTVVQIGFGNEGEQK